MAEKILIVDDDTETLRLVGLMLQRQGYEVVSAPGGEQALKLVDTENPDLIVLDIMMPFLDGYQVTERIRSHAEWSDIPILMFTAKTQVEDKVAGYEAGADDYMTKPVHPAELSARIKSLLGRRRVRASISNRPAGYSLGVVSAKGGSGVSSLALELSVHFYLKTKAEVVAAELRPGQGSWGLQLGYDAKEGLSSLLQMKPQLISSNEVEDRMTRTTYGVRMLLASNKLRDADLFCSTAQILAVMQQVSRMGSFVVFDIGTPVFPGFDQIISMCNELLVVTEAQPEALKRTRTFIDHLGEYQFGKSKTLNVALINHQRSDLQFTVDRVTDDLGFRPITVVPPVPELAHQAALRTTPMSYVQPESIAAKQIAHLVEHYAQMIKVA
jgi:pilus assembly protein CpaE